MTLKLESIHFTEKEVLTYILHGLLLERAKLQAKVAEVENMLRPPAVRVKAATVLHHNKPVKPAAKKASRKRR